MLEGTNAEISASTGGQLAGPIAKTVLDAALEAEADDVAHELSFGIDRIGPIPNDRTPAACTRRPLGSLGGRSGPGGPQKQVPVTTSDRHAIINDRYELTRRIGRGGMADVFLGRDRLLDRQVAIKVLFPEFATDPNFVERFRREAQAAANLSHPNIVNVYDWGRHSGTYYICMEYVEGRTLAEILRTNGHVTAKQAAEIASEVAAALGFAHEAGLVHRDVKPANILIGSNGQVKVADFGIARAMNAPTESNLTQAGAVMGTATYFSPEQAQGAQPDPRSDLYSLGVVMYEMVSGRPPFTGENPVSIAYKQVHDNPQPLNQLVVDIPRSYEAIVAKLLAKDPKIRYPSAAALRDDLRRFRNGDQVLALAAAANAARAVRRPGAVPPTVDARRLLAPTVAQGTTADRLPTGASPEARYYEPPPSRTGWYALAAFFALIALGIGGILLFQALSGDDEPSSFALDDYVGRPLAEVTQELDDLNLNYEPIAEENSTVPVRDRPPHRPRGRNGGRRVPGDQALLQPGSGAAGGAQRRGSAARRGPADPRRGRLPRRAGDDRAERRHRRGLGHPHRPCRRRPGRAGHADRHRRVGRPRAGRDAVDRHRPPGGRGPPGAGEPALRLHRHDGDRGERHRPGRARDPHRPGGRRARRPGR